MDLSQETIEGLEFCHSIIHKAKFIGSPRYSTLKYDFDKFLFEVKVIRPKQTYSGYYLSRDFFVLSKKDTYCIHLVFDRDKKYIDSIGCLAEFLSDILFLRLKYA